MTKKATKKTTKKGSALINTRELKNDRQKEIVLEILKRYPDGKIRRSEMQTLNKELYGKVSSFPFISKNLACKTDKPGFCNVLVFKNIPAKRRGRPSAKTVKKATAKAGAKKTAKRKGGRK